MDGELGDFLRSRRARIQPEEVGLPSYGRRRVPGLRREEVAQLAGVSVDYYIRLEQGRGPSVSDAVLDAIARVLNMDETEHAYLRTVARPRRTKSSRPAAPRVRPGVQLILDGMERVPAFVIGRRLDVLAWNALADALNGFSRMAADERNAARQVFLDPAARDLFPDWSAVAAQNVAQLHLNAGHHPDDSGMAALIGELSLKSEDFHAAVGGPRGHGVQVRGETRPPPGGGPAHPAVRDAHGPGGPGADDRGLHAGTRFGDGGAAGAAGKLGDHSGTLRRTR